MILLTSVQTLEIKLAAAPATTQPTYVSDWANLDATLMTLGAVGTSDGPTNSTTAVTAVAAPSAGSVRRVTGLSLFNGDTVSIIAIVQLNDNGTTRTLWKGLVQNGDSLFYDDQRGFYILDDSGELRVNTTNLGTSSGSSSISAHATTHESGGTDPIPLDTLSAPSDVTTLNASTTKHGLLPKLSGTAADNFKGDGTWSSSVAAANLTGTIASAVQDLITRLGTIVSGVWNGTKIGLAYGGTNADLSATGGSNQLLKQASSGAAITVGTIASANLSDTANIPLLNANNHWTGTGDTTFDGNIKPATSQCMSWTAKTLGTSYQAASDGFVVGTAAVVSVGDRLKVLSDSSNPPTTTRTRIEDVTGTTGNKWAFCCPIRKGDFYKASADATTMTTPELFWVPLGTAG